jgi:hypothetical protein
MDDGSRYVADKLITPKRLSPPGEYIELGNVELVHQLTLPPPIEQVKLGDFRLTQSGAAHPENYAQRDQVPLIPNNRGFFTEMIVTSASPSRVRTSNRFEITEDGHLVSQSRTRPLGDVPYEITLVAQDGARYSAPLDISSSKMRVGAPGRLFLISGLIVEREKPLVLQPDAAPITESDAAFAQSGGWRQQKPSLLRTPMGIYVQNQ